MPIRSSFFALAVAMPSGAEPDSWEQVELPSPMREHRLTNMRDHLLAIETIVRLLAEGRYGEAADTAEERLGLGAMQTHGGHHMAPYMPEGMRAIGRAMHRAASPPGPGGPRRRGSWGLGGATDWARGGDAAVRRLSRRLPGALTHRIRRSEIPWPGQRSPASAPSAPGRPATGRGSWVGYCWEQEWRSPLG